MMSKQSHYLVIAGAFALFGQIVLAGGAPLASDSVIFQTFYWDVPGGGTWYNTIAAAAPGLKEAGFTHFWFPYGTQK